MRAWVGLVLLVLLTLGYLSLRADSAAPATSTAPAMGTAFKPAFEAISYYETNCARCHGPQGSFYGPTLGKNLTDPQLIKIIDDMAAGPGQAALKQDELAVETAFHRGIMSGAPFLSLTKIADGKAVGEVMPDAKVTVIVKGQAVAAAVDGFVWSANVPGGTKAEDIKLIAERAGKKTELVGKSAYSHREAGDSQAK